MTIAAEKEEAIDTATALSAEMKQVNDEVHSQNQILTSAHSNCEEKRLKLESQVSNLGGVCISLREELLKTQEKLSLSTNALKRSVCLYEQLEVEQKLSLRAIEISNEEADQKVYRLRSKSDRLDEIVNMYQETAIRNESSVIEMTKENNCLTKEMYALFAELDCERSKNVRLERLLTASRSSEAESKKTLVCTKERVSQLESKIHSQESDILALEQKVKDNVAYNAEMKRHLLVAQVEIEKLKFKCKFHDKTQQEILEAEKRALIEKHLDEKEHLEKGCREKFKQRHCSKCGEKFSLHQEDERSSKCVYHPGEFKISDLFSLSRWTCCHQLADAVGCKAVDFHTETINK
jgi:hypothetical protein